MASKNIELRGKRFSGTRESWFAAPSCRESLSGSKSMPRTIHGEVESVESSEPVKRTVKTIELSLRARKAIAATAEPRSSEPLVKSKRRSRLRRALARGVKLLNGETGTLIGRRLAGETGPPQPDPEKLERKMHGSRAPCRPERDSTVAARRASMAARMAELKIGNRWRA
jgi:hypothetical protein